MKRRHFLQFAGSTLAALGWSQLDIARTGDRYGRVLVQNTPRKLALLIGVNQYPDGISALRGCVNDTRMQYELLVHRFGFNPANIVTVSDDSGIPPTRQNILDAFENHLINQARPGDVVVFHFSGHGSLVASPDPLPDFAPYEGTIVPFDGRDSTDYEAPAKDITGKTLFLLLSALQTENVTAIFDSCHSGGVRGDLRLRSLQYEGTIARSSRYGDGAVGVHPQELNYQEQWRSRLNIPPDRLQQMRQAGAAKGAVIGSAQIDQWAADASFGEGDGRFYSGAFTYALTRYLWQQASEESLRSTFNNLARRTQDVSGASGIDQLPDLTVAPDSNVDGQPIYLTVPQVPTAEGVLLSGEDRVEFWLGGVSSQSLVAFQTGAIFNLIDRQGRTIGEVEQTDRQGLVGRGIVRSRTRGASGVLLRERVRGVPADLSLRVGVDRAVGDVATARSLLSQVDRVQVADDTADCLLGRATTAAEGIAVGSFGLFSRTLDPIPDTFGRPEEDLNTAVRRLRPRLKMLLAGRILKAIVNSETSSLRVNAIVEAVDGSGGDRVGSRGAIEAGILPETVATPQFSPGTTIQVRVRNDETRNLYIGVLAIGSNGDLVVLFPNDWDAPEDAALVEAGQTLTVPDPQGGFQFVVRPPAGFFELLVLASTEPLRNALRGLQRIAGSRGTRSGDPLPLAEDEPVAVMEDLLGDLDRTTRSGVALNRSVRAVDSTQLAAIAATIEVVD